MATVNSTTATINIVLLARGPIGLNSEQRENAEGDDPTLKQAIIPYKELSDNSMVPKLNDWMVIGSDTWLVEGVSEDPMAAAYTLMVRRL
jgi:hypothetical protein